MNETELLRSDERRAVICSSAARALDHRLLARLELLCSPMLPRRAASPAPSAPPAAAAPPALARARLPPTSAWSSGSERRRWRRREQRRTRAASLVEREAELGGAARVSASCSTPFPSVSASWNALTSC